MLNLFYRNTRLLILTISLIFVWGLSSFHVLPRLEDPALTQRFALITTKFPGASAYRVESLVTQNIEDQLKQIPEIKTLESNSSVGISTVVVKLKDNITEADKVWSRVRDRLDDVTPKLPQGTSKPQYEDIETKAYGMIVALTWELKTPPNYRILGRLGEELEDELDSLSGSEKVELRGKPDEEIVVEISPAELAQLGITSQELSQQIRLSDAKVPAGQLRSDNSDFLIEVDTELDSLTRIREIPVQSTNISQFVRLGDIANVKKGLKTPTTDLAIVNGRPAVVAVALVNSSQRLNIWSRAAHQALEKFQDRLPGGVGLHILFDQNYYVEQRLNNLWKNLIFAVLCVIGSTFLLMGGKSSLIVGSALPLTILMVFGGMNFLGIPLQQISVTGLVIALGLLIDNAIVVVNEVNQKLQLDVHPKKAISQTVSHLAIPLFASTLTTVLAFMPVALMSGPVGEFVNTIGSTVILALVSSLFLSLTLIPALAGRINSTGKKKRRFKLDNLPSVFPRSFIGSFGRNMGNSGFSSPRLTEIYRHILDRILRRPFLGILLALILPLTGFVMVSSLPEQFFPPAEREQFQIELELYSHASIEKTQLVTQQVRETLLRHPEVKDVHWFIGQSAPSFYYNLQRRKKDLSSYAQALVQLKSNERSQELIQSLQKELDRNFPVAQVLVKRLEQGPYTAAPIQLYLYGSDLEILEELGNQIRLELSQVSNIIHTRSRLAEVLPQLSLKIDEEQARLTKLDNTAIAEQINSNLEGNLGGSILEDTEELPVRVRIANARRGDLDFIASLDLVPNVTAATENLSSVPLSALGEIKLIPELASIARRNGKRVNTIEGFVTVGVLPSTVLAQFKERLAASDFQLPPGYSLEFGGESAERKEAVGNLMTTVGVLLVLMVATLVLSFGSFRLAGIIALVGICSVGLGLAALWIFRYPFGFMAILGIVGLIGVAINDSIVLLSALHSDPDVRKGNRKAIREVIVGSTRHVLTTTITTVAGFVPLLLDGGEFWPPLAICVAGGVVGATLLALSLVPCLYLLLKAEKSEGEGSKINFSKLKSSRHKHTNIR